MKVVLFPYTEVDGIRTVPDSDIKRLFTRTVSDGSDKIVFYEGTIKTADEFLRMAKSGSCLFYLMTIGTETIGYTWLNRFENKTARHHFCTFKQYWGTNEETGKTVINMMINWQNKAGGYLLDLLTGFVPAWNKRAIAFALKCGGTSAGIIPNAIWNDAAQKSEDAVFIYYTRARG